MLPESVDCTCAERNSTSESSGCYETDKVNLDESRFQLRTCVPVLLNHPVLTRELLKTTQNHVKWQTLVLVVLDLRAL
jgi:hypothetical protein